MCSSTYGPPGNGRLLLRVLRPALVPAREPSSRASTAGRSSQLLHRVGAELEEDALAAVLDGREPLRLERDLRALDIASRTRR